MSGAAPAVVSADALLGHLGVSTKPDADMEPSNESTLDRDIRAEFDKIRPIRTVILGSSAPVLQRSLNAELTCPVCLGIIRDCTAVMECLHRFCAGCIEKSLRFGKKECPSCRMPVASRRNLRKDEAFSAVISAIYPDLSVAEAAHDSYIADVIRSYNVRKFGNIASKGSRQQKDHARKSTKRPASPPPSAAYGGGAEGAHALLPVAKRARNPNKAEAISFSLLQHPQLASSPLADTYRMQNKFVRTSRYITTLLLKKWLQLKLLSPKPIPAATAATSANGEAAAAKAEQNGDATDAQMKSEGNAQESKEQTEQKTAAAVGDAKMEDTSAATAAAAPAPLATIVPPSVRFVLYVRAFDTALLDGTSSSSSGPLLQLPNGQSGKEMFVPLASDLTLDFIEEHMWNSEARATDQSAAKLAQELAATVVAGTDQEKENQQQQILLKRVFAQAFVSCPSHRKQKIPCTEDCIERIAAWQVFLQKEKEKLNKFKAEKAKIEATAAAAAAAATTAAAATLAAPGAPAGTAAAASAAAAAASPAVAASAAAAAAADAVSAAAANLVSLPYKKRRLVLYYSVVGPDGQLLLQGGAPVMQPEVVQKYIIRNEEDEEEEAEQEQQQTQQQQAAPSLLPPSTEQQQQQQQATSSPAADKPTSMELDEPAALTSSAAAAAPAPQSS